MIEIEREQREKGREEKKSIEMEMKGLYGRAIEWNRVGEYKKSRQDLESRWELVLENEWKSKRAAFCESFPLFSTNTAGEFSGNIDLQPIFTPAKPVDLRFSNSSVTFPPKFSFSPLQLPDNLFSFSLFTTPLYLVFFFSLFFHSKFLSFLFPIFPFSHFPSSIYSLDSIDSNFTLGFGWRCGWMWANVNVCVVGMGAVGAMGVGE